jgi:hypothetical protein
VQYEWNQTLSTCSAALTGYEVQTMRYCGADISGGDLRLAIVDGDADSYVYVATKPARISLTDDEDQALVKSFYDAIGTFMRVNNVEFIAIKKRSTKGKFAGGSITFKIEGLLQVVSGCKVALFSAPTVAAKHKSKNFGFPTGIFSYQKDAFLVACCAMTSKNA